MRSDPEKWVPSNIGFGSICEIAYSAAVGAAAGDPPVVVVAGELVDGVPTPADAIAAAVRRKLKE